MYQLMCGASCLAGAVTTMVATKGSEVVRTATIGVVCALSGLAPMVWLALHDSGRDDRMGFALSEMFAFYVSMGCGGVVFALRLPQRWMPGGFDLMPGHIFWHCAVLFSNVCAFSATFALADVRNHKEGPNGGSLGSEIGHTGVCLV